jgi:hypothetical protein
MVVPLPDPPDPLPKGSQWTWAVPVGNQPWYRVYHKDRFTSSGVHFRQYGPLARLDHHTLDAAGPRLCPEGRSILYVGSTLKAALAEVFGASPYSQVCPNYRVSLVTPKRDLYLVDLKSQGAAMRVGALPQLTTGDYPRPRTQEWARALFEGNPLPSTDPPHGVYYAAAYTGGAAAALWNTPDAVEIPNGGTGAPQDFALHDVWGRVLVAMNDLRLSAEIVDTCAC